MNEENIIRISSVLSKVEPEPDLHAGAGSDQKVPVRQYWLWAENQAVAEESGSSRQSRPWPINQAVGRESGTGQRIRRWPENQAVASEAGSDQGIRQWPGITFIFKIGIVTV